MCRRRLAVGLFAAFVLPIAAARPARAAPGDESLGLNTHVPANDLLDMSADLGIVWIRVDANWLSLQPEPDRYDWAEMDRVVDEASARGLRVFMTLAYTPAWVPVVPRAREPDGSGNDEPAGTAEWQAFVEAAVDRYSARGVTHYGMWNEPNLEHFFEGGADAYVDKILVPGAASVRSACRAPGGCTVLAPDCAHVGDYDVFLDRVMARAASEIDILAHHIYSGWPETGTDVFDGDNFLQALEMRRFPFTRASMREVIDRYGWSDEVWITETGYEADAIGDAADEGRQATYVRRVMEEQLARAWWTNTFFYEITDCGVDQPGCDIDGFGITRPSRAVAAGGPRRFPDDYRLKPAYDEIRNFIAAHPEIVMRAPPAQCANGADDDGDGRIDSRDRGCVDGTDRDEGDDPPRRQLFAAPAPSGGITVDGNLDEWGDAGWVTLGESDWIGLAPYGGPTDLVVRAAARFVTGTLYLAFDVTDDRAHNERPDDQLYLGDSVQVAFDVARNYGDAYDATDDHEINFALHDTAGNRVFRFAGPPGATEPVLSATRVGESTRYEIALENGDVAPATFATGQVLGFSFLVNDDDRGVTLDGTGREGWLELTPGIGQTKSPYLFGEIALVDSAPPPPPPPPPPPGDGGVPPPRTDAGIELPDAGTREDGAAPIDDGGAPLADGSTSGRDGSSGGAGGDDGGCGCVAVGGGDSRDRGAFVWALLLGLYVSARRTSSSARSRRWPRQGS
ncbi:MAG: beta-galactosidase [Deltaproteobacteria bacterium]|nr:beta-galactosidase [Deltaproteobacteria bacterium]